MKIDFSISTALVLEKFSASHADEEENAQEDLLSMSDEDFLNANEEDLAGTSTPLVEDDDGNEEDVEEVDAEKAADEEIGDKEPDSSAQEEDSTMEEPEAEQEEGSEKKSQDQAEESKNENETEFDYEAEFKKLFEPIKANGREIQMKSVDQIRNRIQLAEGFDQKMRALRPYNRTLKTLEKSGLLGNEEQLNFLLELNAKNPNAIKKLIADASIDPLDLVDEEKLEESKNYRPDNHMVSDAEVEIDEAFKDISTSPAYDQTVNVLSNTFDSKSREIISEHPDYIRALNSDIESGIYDQIMQEVQYQREMGYIPRQLSDIEAYIGTVNYLAQQEAAQAQQHQNQGLQPQQQQAAPRSNTTTAKKRKAMASPKGGSVRGKPKYDPGEFLEMSDEEFEKKFGVV